MYQNANFRVSCAKDMRPIIDSKGKEINKWRNKAENIYYLVIESQPASYPVGTGGPFPGVKRGLGMTLTTHPI
jgi:hypothetical protein